MRADWRDSFADAYRRTYKRAAADSKKNLRCFPSCSPDGHRRAGFCGRPIRLILHEPPAAGDVLQAWARFEVASAEPLWADGSFLTEEELEKTKRTRQSPLLPWMRAEVIHRGPTAAIIINEQLLGYHYQWLSTKATCDLAHCVRVYLAESTPATGSSGMQLRCLEHFDSPSFTLFTRHRLQKKSGSPGAESISSGTSTTVEVKISEEDGDAPAPLTSLHSEEASHGPTPQLALSPLEPLDSLGLQDENEGEREVTHQTRGKRRANSSAEFSPSNARPFGSHGFKIPHNRTIDRLVRFIFRFGAAPAIDTEYDVSREPCFTGPKEEARSESMSDVQRLEQKLESELDLLLNNCQPIDNAGTTYNSAPPTMSGGSADGLSQWGEPEVAQGSGPDAASFNIMMENTLRTSMPFDALYTLFDDLPANTEQESETEVNWRLASYKPAEPSIGPRPRTKFDTYGVDSVCEILSRESPEAARSFARDIEILSRACADMVSPGSASSRYFQRVVERWSKVGDIGALRTQLETERNLDFEWSTQHEDETYEENKADLYESSIYAELRHGFRAMIEWALSATGQSSDLYAEAMEAACAARLVTPDPFFPPTEVGLPLLKLHLYGDANAVPHEDYGSTAGVFRDAAQQRAYAKDLLVVRRRIYRTILLSRLTADRKVAHVMRICRTPAPVGCDISGSWEIVERVALKSTRVHGIHEAFSSLTGITFGSFLGAAFIQLWSRINVRVDSEMMVLEGQPILLGHPKFVTPIDGAVVPMVRPTVLPLDTIDLSVTRRMYATFASDGFHRGVLWANHGCTWFKTTKVLIQEAREKLRDPKASYGMDAHRHITEWFASLPEPELETDSPSLVLAKFMYRERNQLKSEVVNMVFPREENVRFTNPEFFDSPPANAFLLMRATCVYDPFSQEDSLASTDTDELLEFFSASVG